MKKQNRKLNKLFLLFQTQRFHHDDEKSDAHEVTNSIQASKQQDAVPIKREQNRRDESPRPTYKVRKVRL